MADIFDEVSEELKHDQLVKIWKKYSKFIIVGIIFTIICIISYQSYMYWNNKKIESISEQYFEALEKLENEKYSQSGNLFIKNLENHKDGYKMLSLFGLAESNYKDGKIDEMILNYKKIYDDESLDVYYRNLSRILSVIKDDISSSIVACRLQGKSYRYFEYSLEMVGGRRRRSFGNGCDDA